MYVIAGLGNPGDKYNHTRHNAGFDAIDILAEKYNIPVRELKFKGLIGKGFIEGENVLLVKPMTYMNNSGECIGEIMRYYHLDPEEDLVILSDDVTLDPGVIRVRKKGSAGGHNGLKDIIAHCDTQNFPRVRIGVGKLPVHGDMIAHVLGHLPAAERPYMQEGLQHAAEAAILVMQQKTEEAMNIYNGMKRES